MSIIDKVMTLDIGGIGFILTVASFVFAIISIFFLITNTTALKSQNKNAIKAECNERFKNAIEQLGSKKNAIILGGIYTLHRIAKEDKSYRENVFNILCSYVRNTTKKEGYQKKYKETPSEPVQTILNILCVNKIDFKIYSKFKIDFKIYSAFKIDFSGAYLRGAYLYKVNLTFAYLSGVNLTSANLYITTLVGAYLYEVNFTGANLTSANLTSANLTSAYLVGANLTGTNLLNANFTYANLLITNLTGANLMYANLTYVDLGLSNLKGVTSNGYCKSFEECIKSRIGIETDLSGIKGYDPENPPFRGKPIIESYNREEAEEIIKEYNDLIDKSN